MIDRLIEWLFIGFIALKPMYLFRSGGLQISDVLMILLLFLILLRSGMRIRFSGMYRRWVNLFLLAVVYQLGVNICSYLFIGQINLLTNSLYYVFNFFVVVIAVSLKQLWGSRALIDRFTLGMFLSSVVNLIGMLLDIGRNERAVGFFNNPNQLGYYCVILLTVALIFKSQISKKKYWFMVVSATLGTVISLSKAAIIGLGVALVIDAFYLSYRDLRISVNGILKRIFKIVGVFAVIYLVMFSSIPFIAQNSGIIAVRNRIASMAVENDTTLGAGRGYDRIAEIGVYIFTGVGEGAFDRFEVMNGREVHSTFPNLLVSYGIIGTVLYTFTFILPMLKRKKTIRSFAYMLGVFLYGFTHNGIRFSLFWLLLAMIMISEDLFEPVAQIPEEAREKNRVRPRRGRPWRRTPEKQRMP